jgi:hypothetical protein
LRPRWNLLGVGISLTGPTLRALKSISLIDECVGVAFGFDRIVFADAAGNQFSQLNMPRLSGPDYPAAVAIARSALHEVLIRASERLGATIALGVTAALLDERGDAVEVTFSDGRSGTYDFVVGCDGFHSTVRKLTFHDVPEANFTGLAVWRATMPRHKDVDSMQMFYGPNTKAGVNRIPAMRCSCFSSSRSAMANACRQTGCIVLLAEQLRDFSGECDVARPRMCERSGQGRLPADEFVSAAIAVAPRPRRGDRRCGARHHAASGNRSRDRHRGCRRAGGTAGQRSFAAELLERFMARRFDRCRLVVETAVKLGEMEKDKTIPIQAHFDLMSATFRQLGEPI